MPVTADQLREWIDVLEAVETPINLHDKDARKTIDALDEVAREMREEYLRALMQEVRSA